MIGSDVAVVIPVFNRARTVLGTLSTVTSQTQLPRRLVVVDDGSTDSTSESIRKWIDSTPSTIQRQLIWQSNRGAPAARNRGLAAIGDCEFVAFLDSDDRWPNDFLARVHTRISIDPTAVAVSTDRRQINRLTGKVRQKSSRGLTHNATRWLLTKDGGVGSCSVFRASVLQSLGGYDESLPTGQDTDLFLRVSLEGPWLYAEGDAVAFQIGLAAAHGEEGNLSYKYADRQRRWAIIREKFIRQQSGPAGNNLPEYRRCLARRWYKAGCQFMRDGRRHDALDCFGRALRWYWIHAPTWWRLIQMRWTGTAPF